MRCCTPVHPLIVLYKLLLNILFWPLRTFSWPLTTNLWLTFSFVSSKHIMLTQFCEHRTTPSFFHLQTSTTSTDRCVTFDPYPWTIYMKNGSVILTDQVRWSSVFICKTSSILSENDLLVPWDTFLTTDKELVIDFSLCLVKTHMITKWTDQCD